MKKDLLVLVKCALILAAAPVHAQTPPADSCAAPNAVVSPAEPTCAALPAPAHASSWEGPRGCVGAYCVFANARFGRGGIALVTTRGNAKRVRALRPDAEPTAGRAPPFRTKAVAGKGVGLVARRPIARGDLVMAETPALLVHKRALEEPTDVYFPSLELAVASLAPDARRAFMAQGGQGDFAGAMGIMDRLFTNSFQVALVGGDNRAAGFHYGNFPRVSLLNHDCRPNLIFHIDENLVHRTHAVRDIAEGEELTISYVDEMEPTEQRQARTRSSLGFACGCAQCSLSASEAAESEQRVQRIRELEEALEAANGGRVESLAAVDELLSLYATDRLESRAARAYMLAALTYQRVGDVGLAREYGVLAAQALAMERGQGSEDVEVMRRLAEAS